MNVSKGQVSKRLVERTLYNLKRCSFLKIMMLDKLQNVRIKHSYTYLERTHINEKHTNSARRTGVGTRQTVYIRP